METKFYVGQRVNSLQSGKGTVESINGPLSSFPIVIKFDTTNPSLSNYRTIDGKIFNHETIDLFPIDPPRVVLTEWQKKQLREYVREEFKYTALFNFFDRLESILSEPEPPKYQPKQGEAVIFRDRKDCPWSASVATGIYWRIYYYGDTLDAFEVRPFDASLIGQVTND